MRFDPAHKQLRKDENVDGAADRPNCGTDATAERHVFGVTQSASDDESVNHDDDDDRKDRGDFREQSVGNRSQPAVFGRIQLGDGHDYLTMNGTEYCLSSQAKVSTPPRACCATPMTNWSTGGLTCLLVRSTVAKSLSAW